MKGKGILFATLISICCTLAACSQRTNNEYTSTADSTISEVDLPSAVVYNVEPLQNVSFCKYYKQGQTPPVFNGDAGRFFEKIHIGTQCSSCGKKDISTKLIDPSELDFSSGDTIQYSDSDQCFDCYQEKDLQQFMWSIRISRTTVRACSQCKKTEPDVTFSSNTPSCDGCNYNGQGNNNEEKLICSQCGADCTYRGLEEDGLCEECFLEN